MGLINGNQPDDHRVGVRTASVDLREYVVVCVLNPELHTAHSTLECTATAGPESAESQSVLPLHCNNNHAGHLIIITPDVPDNNHAGHA